MTNQEAAEMIRNDIKLHHDYLSGQYRKALNVAINALLKEQPEIVRCKDCKHFHSKVKDEFTTVFGCSENHGSWGKCWFCADGEAKDKDGQ